MKFKYLFYVALIFTGIHYSSAQQFDMNWYVLQNKGLNGPALANSPDPNNHDAHVDIWSNPLENKFFISGIKHPNHEQAGRDDIFVIFEDGSFYSSRPLAHTPWEYYIGNEHPLSMGIQTEQAVQYLYWTNRYDDDDDPDQIQVQSIDLPAPHTSVSSIRIPNEKRIYANQDVVYGKDIIVILDLNIQEGNINFPESYTHDVYLQFNQLSPYHNYNDGELSHPDSLEIVDNIFETSAAFGEKQFVFPINTEADVIGDKIKLTINRNMRYIYLALQGTRKLNELTAPGGRFAGYNAVFQLLDAEEQEVQHRVERVGPVHDPNYLIAKEACFDSNTVYYVGSFHNITTNKACDVGVAFSLPTMLDTATIKITHATYDGKDIKIDSIINGIENRVGIFFDKKLCIKDSLPLDFGFCIKMKDGSGALRDQEREKFIPNEALTIFFSSRKNPLYYPLTVGQDLNHAIDTPVIYSDIGSSCNSCPKKNLPPTTCKWYNCVSFWLENYRWIWAILVMGILASVSYFRLQKDKQRRL